MSKLYIVTDLPGLERTPRGLYWFGDKTRQPRKWQERLWILISNPFRYLFKGRLII